MDLSKIPEPTAKETEGVASWIDDYALCGEDWIVPREVKVIAHLLRHGSVLAAFAKRHNMHKSSVEFFEKFGGNDDR